jgi:hypothetical protein
MYYIWSLIISVIVFAAIQYNEYCKDPKYFNAWSVTNLSTFIIIYIIATIVLYILFSTQEYDSTMFKGNTGGSDMHIDPVLLRRIPDQIYTGFSPYHAELI